MIEWIKQFIAIYPNAAPFVISLSLILAGFNIPISADMIILIAATLAVTVLKGSFLKLYLAVFIGSTCAAYIAYAQGRFLGPYLLKKKFFQKLFPEQRLAKIKLHYAKHSLLTLIIGRFIPFGFRNGLFISTGLARFSFKKLAMQDAVACFIWSLTVFAGFYKLLSKVEDVVPLLKKFNLIIFSILGLSIIGFVWYKQIKRRRFST